MLVLPYRKVETFLAPTGRKETRWGKDYKPPNELQNYFNALISPILVITVYLLPYLNVILEAIDT